MWLRRGMRVDASYQPPLWPLVDHSFELLLCHCYCGTALEPFQLKRHVLACCLVAGCAGACLRPPPVWRNRQGHPVAAEQQCPAPRHHRPAAVPGQGAGRQGLLVGMDPALAGPAHMGTPAAPAASKHADAASGVAPTASVDAAAAPALGGRWRQRHLQQQCRQQLRHPCAELGWCYGYAPGSL